MPMNGSVIDGWFMTDKNVLENQKLPYDCVAAGTCAISLTPPGS